jgi:UDP-N-acetylglucosamine 2-epimerase (non-hydrolysing)
MLSILSIIGTRPEAIKMAPVIKQLYKYPKQINSILCVTGQHREMLDQILNLFHIIPDFDLNLMRPNQTLPNLTALLLTHLDSVISKTKPHFILAQGDTTTVLVSSLMAYYYKIPFGHVEAGLRTGDKYKPFPEEINRRIADSVADLHFAPTELAKNNLVAEGCLPRNIYITGNTVVDALLEISGVAYDWTSGPLSSISDKSRIVLITAHRRESFGKSFRNICSAIRELAYDFYNEGFHFVYPVHLNPNVKKPVFDILSDIPNISLIEPLDYLSMVHLMKRSRLILTDSGGIQEEASTFGVPTLVMRDQTERPEGVASGNLRLVGTNTARIVQETNRLLTDPSAYAEMSRCTNPYGDGRASERIASILLNQ